MPGGTENKDKSEWVMDKVRAKGLASMPAGLNIRLGRFFDVHRLVTSAELKPRARVFFK